MSVVDLKPPRVSELLPVSQDLIVMAEDPSLNPLDKDDLLVYAQTDPTYRAAVDMHGDLQLLANGLRRLAFPDEYSNRSAQSVESMLQARYENAGDFDELTDLGDVIFSLPESISKTMDRKTSATHMRRLASRQIHAAHLAAHKAESYRGFNVGCRGFYIDEDNGRIGMFSSYNIKPHYLKPKYCAERANLEKAQELGFTYCVGLVVMGISPQLDPGSGVASKAQPPCGVCRADFSTNPLMDEDSLIICANTDSETEELSVRELLSVHGNPLAE